MLGGVTEVASFETELRLVRGDYGVGSWAANVVVGDDVDISIAVEANRRWAPTSLERVGGSRAVA